SRRCAASLTARSISPATVRAFFWVCQPLSRPPEYSINILYRGIVLAIGVWRLPMPSCEQLDRAAGDGRVLEADAGQIRDRDLVGRRPGLRGSRDDLAELRL